MLCVIATIETPADRRDELLTIFRDLTPHVLAEKGCIEYIVTVDTPSDFATQIPIRDNVVTVVEKWESLAALEAHNQMPHMADFRKRAESLLLNLSLQILDPA